MGMLCIDVGNIIGVAFANLNKLRVAVLVKGPAFKCQHNIEIYKLVLAYDFTVVGHYISI